MRADGFTLIELLTAMAVLVVLVGLGVPSFLDFITRSRATTEYRELVTAISTARSEAVTRARRVNISAVNGSAWNQGYRIWVDINGNGNYDTGEALRQSTAFRSNAELAVTGNTPTLTFTGEGFLDAATGTEFVFSYRTKPEHCSLDRDIRLKHTGHISIQERACD